MPTKRELNENLSVETPEQISINYSVAASDPVFMRH